MMSWIRFLVGVELRSGRNLARRGRGKGRAAWVGEIETIEPRLLLSAKIDTPRFIVDHTNDIGRAAVNAPTGLTPAMISQAYGFNNVMFGSVVGDGSGETIAIVDAYNAPTITTDLHAFDVEFGLSDPTLVRINQAGGTTLPGNDPEGPGNRPGPLETSLDVEWA